MSTQTEPVPLAAELLGTFFLVFFGVGSAVLASQFLGAVGVALAFGLTLLALVHVLGPVSGAHLNPAVTLAMLLTRRMEPRLAGLYALMQFIGAIIGAAVLYLLARQVPDLETKGAFGSNGFSERSAVDLSVGGALLTELVLTLLLVFVWLSVTPGVKLRRTDGVPLGLALVVVTLVGIPLTGASVNPARSLGPALFAGGDALAQYWLFLITPLAGAALAVGVHLALNPGAGRAPVSTEE